MSATSELVTDVLTLESAPPDLFDHAFVGRTGPCPWPKAYGGDMVAQALVAAIRTVTDGKVAHSMHSYFMRPVDIGEPVRYEVEVLRDGRGYSTRQVRGVQNGKVAYAALVSFAAGEPSGSYAAAMPSDLPAPESLPSSADYLDDRSGGTMTEQSKTYWSSGRSFDMRHAPGPIYLSIDGPAQPHQAVWVRPFDALREVANLTAAQRNQAALSYVCDYTILEPALRVLGVAWAEPGLVTASLDHAMWFHRDVPMDGWLLYAQEAVSVESGRGLGTGRFFTPEGILVATVAQEGMLRTPRETP